jgi:hypothetical protein
VKYDTWYDGEAAWIEEVMAIKVLTSYNRITIPIDIEWELTRQENLKANGYIPKINTEWDIKSSIWS